MPAEFGEVGAFEAHALGGLPGEQEPEGLGGVAEQAHVVPVFTGRFWRFSLTDRFDHYPVDADAVSAVLADDCDFLYSAAFSFDQILTHTADETLAAVGAPIPGMPASWEAFWQPAAKAEAFGEYGPAGNSFGRATRFRCGAEESCVLLDADPLYAEFALARHVSAVRGSLHAIRLLQQSLEAGYANAD